jgi:1,4-dihydroxy-2-naphthoyl-CoA hydrolase
MTFPSSITLAMLNDSSQGNMASFLDILYTHIAPDYLEARMPITPKTRQPQGILSGGASVALAETIGSVAANLFVDQKKYYCLGLSINANHIRKVREGYVYAVARPLHIGKTTHVWQIHITDAQKQLVCASRLTMAVLTRIKDA